MPKRKRSIDRRGHADESGDDGEQSDVDAAVERAPAVDMVAFCVACGCNDASQFSRRMLERKGRFGDRTRRCKACVAASTDAESSAKRPSEVASKWEAAQLLQQRNAVGWEQALTSSRSGARDVDAANAKGRQLVAEEARKVDLAMQSAGREARMDKQRKKLQKALRQIVDLKEMAAAGVPLEATQELKIMREAALKAELSELDASHAESPPDGASDFRGKLLGRGREELMQDHDYDEGGANVSSSTATFVFKRAKTLES